MSPRKNLLYAMLPIAFPFFCLGAWTGEPYGAIIPVKEYKTYTKMNRRDAVRLSHDLYEKGCNSLNIFFQLDLPIFPVCDAKLPVKGNDLQVKYNERQKRYNISEMAQFWLRKKSTSAARSRASAKNTAAAIMSGECMLPISTPKLGYVYGNCSGLYHEESSDFCLGACGAFDPFRFLIPVICKRKTRDDICQMASGEMRRLTTISCQCSS